MGPRDTLYVLSDHGFAPFRRQFSLVTWLEREGYLVYESPVRARISEVYRYVDWGRTRAYGVGFNGLFINLAGREARGPVRPAQYEPLVGEIQQKLLSLRDADGSPVFRSVRRRAELYAGARLPDAPDLVLGYELGYGPADESVMGTWTEHVLSDRLEGFTGQYVTDPSLVPGVLFSSRPLQGRAPRLEDVTATLLAEFGIAPTPGMTGQDLL